MAFVTLIGKKLAKTGNEFVYIGITQQCRNCKLKTVCSNLKSGRSYKILKVREKEHKCDLHEGTVVAIEIEKLPFAAAVKKERSKGTVISFHDEGCKEVSCKNYLLCHPGVNEKEYRIVETLENVECPLGYTLTRVILDD
jgi:uncharacterized protein (UPF0179 family)